MRRNALIFIAVVVVVVGLIYYFVQDDYIEHLAEKTGESVFGAKVEIDDLDISLFGLSMTWERLQIANRNAPMQNILETGRANMDIEFRPLFWGKMIINEMRLENVRTATPRATDGSLPIEPTSDEESMFTETKNNLNQQLRELPALDLGGLAQKLNIDSLIDIDKLSSVNGYRQLSSRVDSSKENWQQIISKQDYEARVQHLAEKIKAIDLQAPKNLIELQNTLKQLDDINKEYQNLQSQLKEDKDQLSKSVTDARDQLTALQTALNQDLERAKGLARLRELDVRDIGLMLFGEPIISRIDQLLYYVGITRRYLPAGSILFGGEKDASPPRFEGQDIRYPFHYRYPKFLIRTIMLSGATGKDTSGYALSGQLDNLTNQPAVIGKPTTLDINVGRAQDRSYALRAVFDHITETAKDSIWIHANDLPFGALKLAGNAYLPNRIRAEKGSVTAQAFFIGSTSEITLSAKAAPVTFSYRDEQTGRIGQAVREVLAGLNQIDVEAAIRDKKLRVKSNVDNVLSNQLKSYMDKQLADARQKLETKVRGEIDKYRTQAEQSVAAYRSQVEEKLAAIDARLQEEKQKLEAKKAEIEQRITAEKKKAEEKISQEKKKVEDEAKKKLENIFNKKKDDGN